MNYVVHVEFAWSAFVIDDYAPDSVKEEYSFYSNKKGALNHLKELSKLPDFLQGAVWDVENPEAEVDLALYR